MTKGRSGLGLLIGFTIGVGLTLLFAPQSGEDTRDWIAFASRRFRRRLRSSGRRSLDQMRDLLERAEERIPRSTRSRGNGPETEISEL